MLHCIESTVLAIQQRGQPSESTWVGTCREGVDQFDIAEFHPLTLQDGKCQADVAILLLKLLFGIVVADQHHLIGSKAGTGRLDALGCCLTDDGA